MTTDIVVLSRLEKIEIITKRDGPDCYLCKIPFNSIEEITLDHVIPQSKGGTWAIENLKLAHKRCNALKGDRLLDENGELPPLKREPRSIPRAVKRGARPTLCDTCMSGRILLPGEFCDDCGSGAQPSVAPRAMQVSPKDCDHSTSHCWLCFLGFIDRKAAIITVVDAENID